MSLPVRVGLFTALKNNSTITSLVGERIYHGQAPANSAFPFIVFNKQAGVKTRAMSTPEAVKWDTWLVKGVDRGTSSNKVDEISSAIDTVLDGQLISVSGKTNADLHHVGDVEYLETDGDQTYRHAGATYAIVLV